MADEDAERREPGALLSYGFWQQHFGGDPRVLGQSVTISRRLFYVIGIAPKGFRGVGQEAVDAWILLPVSPDICSFTAEAYSASAVPHIGCIQSKAPGWLCSFTSCGGNRVTGIA